MMQSENKLSKSNYVLYYTKESSQTVKSTSEISEMKISLLLSNV